MTNPPDLDERWDQLVEAVRVEFWRLPQDPDAVFDAADVDDFSQFQVDYIRFEKEVREGQRDTVPWPIIRALGSVSYMRPDFIKRVRDAVDRKKRELPGTT